MANIWVGLGGFPRRNRRGLIEALRTQMQVFVPPYGFPRRNRRGLIEASHNYCRRVQHEPSGFPGGIAGASLKPSHHRTERIPRRRFPRRNRRGLIEAAKFVGAFNPLNSLGFPRRNRRGLIEAARIPHRRRKVRRRFPRRNRRGLIEASTPGRTSPSRSTWFPRRNRRGLIEAEASETFGPCSHVGVSPAESPGPH